MHNFPSSEFHDDENIYYIEEGCILGKKITGVNLSLVVIYERSPLLTSPRIARMNHIPSNRACSMLDSELDFQLLVSSLAIIDIKNVPMPVPMPREALL